MLKMILSKKMILFLKIIRNVEKKIILWDNQICAKTREGWGSVNHGPRANPRNGALYCTLFDMPCSLFNLVWS